MPRLKGIRKKKKSVCLRRKSNNTIILNTIHTKQSENTLWVRGFLSADPFLYQFIVGERTLDYEL